ncbi:MAG: GyrI-like domain-containing protein [Bacteroidota bacterium]
MNKTEIATFTLTGLALKTKTWNANGQSAIDCGSLWQQFEKGNYADKIPGKLGDDIIAVYHNYEGDHTQPFSYFIGCRVAAGSAMPEGMDSLTIEKATYQQFIAKGKMPDCVGNTWREIWKTNIDRAYIADFEVYDERSKDWNDALVDIFIGVKEEADIDIR